MRKRDDEILIKVFNYYEDEEINLEGMKDVGFTFNWMYLHWLFL